MCVQYWRVWVYLCVACMPAVYMGTCEYRVGTCACRHVCRHDTQRNKMLPTHQATPSQEGPVRPVCALPLYFFLRFSLSLTISVSPSVSLLCPNSRYHPQVCGQDPLDVKVGLGGQVRGGASAAQP